jgi:hypothetical protein
MARGDIFSRCRSIPLPLAIVPLTAQRSNTTNHLLDMDDGVSGRNAVAEG